MAHTRFATNSSKCHKRCGEPSRCTSTLGTLYVLHISRTANPYQQAHFTLVQRMHPGVGTEVCVLCSDLLHVARCASRSGSCVTAVRKAGSDNFCAMHNLNFG